MGALQSNYTEGNISWESGAGIVFVACFGIYGFRAGSFFLEGRNKNYRLFLEGEGRNTDAVAVFDRMIYSSIENQQHEIS